MSVPRLVTVILVIACMGTGIYLSVSRFARSAQRTATLKDVAMHLRDYERTSGGLPLRTPEGDWRIQLALHIRNAPPNQGSRTVTADAVRNQLHSVGAFLLPDEAWLLRGAGGSSPRNPYLLIYWEEEFSRYRGSDLYSAGGQYWVKTMGTRELIDITGQVAIRWNGSIETLKASEGSGLFDENVEASSMILLE